MARRRVPRITVIAAGTPPPLQLRPFAMEVLRVLEATKRPSGRRSGGSRKIETAPGTGHLDRSRLLPVNRLDAGSFRPATLTLWPSH
jgi:hypothetical protein